MMKRLDYTCSCIAVDRPSRRANQSPAIARATSAIGEGSGTAVAGVRELIEYCT